MSEISVYKWEDIRKCFPHERVAEIRAKILELRESGKYTDRELWEMYGMSECTFYDLAKRAKDVVMEIRSDGGLEFNNTIVREYCNKNNIIDHILPKAHPWLNAFIERAIETLQYEFINLQYHATFNDFQKFLVIAKRGYNLREHSSFNYRSPMEIWNSSGVS